MAACWWCKTVFLGLAVSVWWICAVDGQALTPPNFNLAVGRDVDATSTCGVGVTEPELYCKLTGANPGDKEDIIGEFELIQGQLCDYCSDAAREPGQSHGAQYAVDGTERWWQSPPLSRGLQYNEVNLSISLGQVNSLHYTLSLPLSCIMSMMMKLLLDVSISGPAEVDNDWSGRTSGFYGRYFQKEAQKDYRVSSGVLVKIEVGICSK